MYIHLRQHMQNTMSVSSAVKRESTFGLHTLHKRWRHLESPSPNFNPESRLGWFQGRKRLLKNNDIVLRLQRTAEDRDRKSALKSTASTYQVTVRSYGNNNFQQRQQPATITTSICGSSNIQLVIVVDVATVIPR